MLRQAHRFPIAASTCLLVLAGCLSRTQQPTPRAFAGWYYLTEGHGDWLRPCDRPRPWQVIPSRELRSRAKNFGLDAGTPVYIRGRGRLQGDVLTVDAIDQFGSTTPVRDCPMNGLVLPSP